MRILSFYQKLKEIHSSNLLLVISLFVALIQIYLILYTSITFLPIFELELYKFIYIIILIYMTIISFLRFITLNPLFKTYWMIEIVSVLPSWILIIFYYHQFYDLTGAIYFKGTIFLRLIPIIQILIEEKTFYLREHYPIFFNKMMNTVGLSIIFFLFSGGIFTSYLYTEYLTKEKENRLIQVQNLTKSYPLQELYKQVPGWILKIEQNQQGKYYEIYYYDKSFVQNHLIPNIHFVYAQGKDPSEGIFVSFIDLYKNKNYLEIIYLTTSFIITAVLSILLRYYYKTYVFLPIEKANIVLDLRLSGEEIPFIDLSFIRKDQGYDEILNLIKKIDLLYHKLLELED